jgi:hypothetical protein
MLKLAQFDNLLRRCRALRNRRIGPPAAATWCCAAAPRAAPGGLPFNRAR